jgi:steroid delta-isomerase-like uncharacterized protein
MPTTPAAEEMVRLVRGFYEDAQNRWDDSVVDDLLAPGFRFRGSLGDEGQGRDSWRAYRDKVRAAVPDFHNEIVDLVTSPGRAAARLISSGHQEGTLLGVPGSGRLINYAGAAFFTGSEGRLATLWVLGDLEALRRQLGEPEAAGT